MANDGRLSLQFPSEVLRERTEALEERRLLELARNGAELCWEPDDEPEPLVTIRIATYNRGKLVADRAIASACRQSYKRIEVLVIGDQCDDATATAIRTIQDKRVRFVNLPVRGAYPKNPALRWMVAGAAPMNAGLMLASGKWIAPCDDDDELTTDHVEVLLEHARRHRLEMVWSQAEAESSPGVWELLGTGSFDEGYISHGTVLYSAHLRFFRHSLTSWKIDEPSDWNLWRRMARAGVKMGFCPRVTYTHYLEGATKRR